MYGIYKGIANSKSSFVMVPVKLKIKVVYTMLILKFKVPWVWSFVLVRFSC